ncbi:MAG: hypothetical protein U0359_07290 [Byssovorax sp.]
MTPITRSHLLEGALITGISAATLLLWLSTFDVLVALAPVALAAGVWALLRAPPHLTAISVFFLAIVVDNPKEHPFEDRFVSPLKPLGVALYENLNTLTGVGALRFSGSDVLLAALFLAAIAKERRSSAVPPPPALSKVLGIAWLSVIWMELWGMLRGGDFKASLWQARPLFWAPVIALVFARSVRGPADHLLVGKAVILAALIKASFAIYFYFIVCRPLGYYPGYATTHSDTVLFVAASVIALAIALEERKLPTALASLAVLLWVGLGIIVNGRRVAYLSLTGSIAAIRLVLPDSPIRRSFDRLLVRVVPIAAVYLALGWTSNAAVFGPARKVASLFSAEDRSAGMRDIENFNLTADFKHHLLTGIGFGNAYNELTRPEGIEQIFPLYRYIGHNSILWLHNAGGLVGFASFWLQPALLSYLAARSYRFATCPRDRAAALACLSVVVIFGVQAQGDMGLNSWTAMFFLGMSLALSAKLAVASGALSFPHAPVLSGAARSRP